MAAPVLAKQFSSAKLVTVPLHMWNSGLRLAATNSNIPLKECFVTSHAFEMFVPIGREKTARQWCQTRAGEN